jgi:hypothetical protein
MPQVAGMWPTAGACHAGLELIWSCASPKIGAPKPMRRSLSIFSLAFLLLLSALVFAEAVTCPVDNSTAYFTGKTKTAENGKQMWLYKCTMYGHEFWVVK